MPFEPCPYCLSDVRVTWWHHLFGLSTRCRSCGAYSGEPWSPARLAAVAAASLLLNALVLFAMTRPVRAVVLIMVHVATAGALFAASDAYASEALYFTAFVALILGPACIAALEYYWHSMELRQGPIYDTYVGRETADGTDDAADHQSSAAYNEPQFIGTARLEQLRNELEIAIYHRKDHLRTLAKTAYAVSILTALLAALEQRWTEIAVAAILLGIAHTAEQHESRAFSGAYLMAGVALLARFAHARVQGLDSPNDFALPVGVFIIGFGLTKTTFSLARLRRARSRIHLEPAEHLQH